MGDRELNPSIPYKEYPGTIMAGYMGSISHGTYIPNTDPNSIDDIDVMAVAVATKDQYLGLGHYLVQSRFEQEIWKEAEWDVITFDVRKFIYLLLKQNPNVVGLLWLPEDKMFINTRWSKMIIDRRELFSSKMAYESFAGYARGQMHKMTHYTKEGYMGEKRMGLVNKYGYDVKNAAHLIRLLKMCIEFLETGVFNVDRTNIDAEELKQIKTGGMALMDVKVYADQLFHKAHDAYLKCSMRETPDYDLANKLTQDIVEDYFYGIRN